MYVTQLETQGDEDWGNLCTVTTSIRLNLHGSREDANRRTKKESEDLWHHMKNNSAIIALGGFA
jgi:hypothetical protein